MNKVFVSILCFSYCITVVTLWPINESETFPQRNSNNSGGILYDESEIDAKGNYRFGYVTADGGKRAEVGTVKNSYLKVEGAYELVGDDGETYLVKYVADERGYRPVIEQI